MADNVPAATPFLEYRLRLVGDRLPEAKKDPNLAIQVKKNEVTLTCNTGLFGADQRQVTIQVKMDAMTFGLITNHAADIGGKEPGFKFPLVRCYSPRKRNPGEQGTPKLLAGVVLIGKDQNGCCYISVMKKDPPHIKFIFRPSQWNDLVDATTNQPAEMSVVSCIYSKAWATIMAPLVVNVLSTDIYDFRAEQDQNGGGNNNYQNNRGQQNNGNYGNQSQAPAAAAAPAVDTNGWDADIPM